MNWCEWSLMEQCQKSVSWFMITTWAGIAKSIRERSARHGHPKKEWRMNINPTIWRDPYCVDAIKCKMDNSSRWEFCEHFNNCNNKYYFHAQQGIALERLPTEIRLCAFLTLFKKSRLVLIKLTTPTLYDLGTVSHSSKSSVFSHRFILKRIF